jgi:predicted GNAT family acetyltransferase
MFTDAKRRPRRQRVRHRHLPLATAACDAVRTHTGGTPLATGVDVTNNPDRNRYEAVVDTATVAGFVDYQETSELVVLTHTEVDPAHEGRGVGGALARAALDDIRERRLKALVICPFIIGWLRNHPEYRDVLFNAPPSTASD